MKILIVGAGEVGSHLATLLSREEQDIVLVDRDAVKLDPLDAKYNLRTVCGSPTSFATLKDAKASKCDLFIAVTPFETDNITACAIAKSMGAKKTVARIDNYEYMRSEHQTFFQAHGVDSVIYPEFYAAKEIITALRHSWVRHWFEMWNGELILIGIKLRQNASITGMRLRDFGALGQKFHVSAIRRKHDTIIPGGNDTVMADDIVYFMTRAEHVDELRELCGKKENNINKIMILGASRITSRLCNMIGDSFDIKVIDPDCDACLRLAERCPKADVVCGDGRDNDMLIEEGIDNTDAFLALSDSSESNILACLTANELGVRKTIAEVENIQYIGEAEALNIGTVVNKKLLAAGAIFQRMLDQDSDNSKVMALADAEVAEIEVKPGSKITRAAVKDLNLSHDMTIAGLIRDGHGQLVSGNTIIRGGDRVVVFCLSGAVHKFEKLFS
ncbi:MAG: Trk system potassium transporter TrkA [Bacteroides sp.]|nr:Trk system potassium transporter TrkA [Bacteroides sp.]MCM1379892.1 Trk system potassium transporter TrkA [Bacteroides sp.]MCM1446254.1 Trk system potassium transporter TrkA [Prevotella sp.]